MSELAPGFLVAAPPLGDPNFDRSVVLLADHGQQGAFGWIINGQELMTISELLLKAEITDRRLDVPGVVRVGGPVAPEQVWLIYKAESPVEGIEGQLDLGVGIAACASRRILEAVVSGTMSSSLVGLAGYAGWAPLQLENEIRAGAWLPMDVDLDVVFDTPSQSIWERAYQRLGTTPMAFTSRTVGSA